MEKLATTHQSRKVIVIVLLLCVLAIGVGVGFVVVQRTKSSIRTTPPEYRRVSSITGTQITLTIKQDTQGMYFEHDGTRLSNANRITGVILNTDYLLTVTNETSSRQGILIPVTKDTVLVDPEQSVTIPLVFRTPGTHSFIGAVYASDWGGLTSGFDVSP